MRVLTAVALVVMVAAACSSPQGEAEERAISAVRGAAWRGVASIQSSLDAGVLTPGQAQIGVELERVDHSELLDETVTSDGTEYLLTYLAGGTVGGGWVGTDAQARLCAVVTVSDSGRAGLSDATCPDAVLRAVPDVILTDIGAAPSR